MKNAASPLFRNHNRSALEAGTYITHRVIYYSLVKMVINGKVTANDYIVLSFFTKTILCSQMSLFLPCTIARAPMHTYM